MSFTQFHNVERGSSPMNMLSTGVGGLGIFISGALDPLLRRSGAPPPHVMIWAAILSNHLKGPHFFDGPVYQHLYLTILKEWFVPQPQRLNADLNICWFRQDGTPTHYAITVREYLNEIFWARWIDGRGKASNKY